MMIDLQHLQSNNDETLQALSANDDECDVSEFPIFSTEWEWDECCHHTIE